MDFDQTFMGGCGEPAVPFEDDASFFVLENYLQDEASGFRVDQYDGAVAEGPVLTTLRENLLRAREEVSRMPSSWVVRTDRWVQAGKQHSIEYRATRDTVLKVTSGLIDMLQEAADSGRRVVFVGD